MCVSASLVGVGGIVQIDLLFNFLVNNVTIYLLLTICAAFEFSLASWEATELFEW